MSSADKVPTQEDGSGRKQRIDLDTILVTELGQLGWYQLRVLALVVVASIFIGFSTNEFVFTAGRISTRCVIPECEPDGPQEFLPEWILNAVPPSGSSFDNCVRYMNTSALRADTCPAELFDQSQTKPCNEFVYENTNTIVYDFGLACDEWRRTLVGSMRTFGTLLALPISGYISDRWGRRITLSATVFNGAWLGVVRYWANSYVGFLISVLVESAMGSGSFACAYILMMEVMGPKYRLIAGATMNSAFAVSQVLMGLFAWAVPNWRSLTLTLYIPQLLSIVYYWIMAESVRWLMSKGRYDESEGILRRIAKANKTHITDKSLQELRESYEEINQKAMKKSHDSGEPWLVVQVFRNKAILLRCVVSPVWWITLTFIYYGLSINSVNITGHQHFNFMAVSAVEIPGYWVSVYLMNKVGRKFVLVLAYWICAACQVGYIFLPDDQYGISLTVYLIGKCSISMVVTAIYVYTAELYPTKHRHSLFAFSSMMGRIGSIVAPFTPAIGAAVWEQLPFVLFGGMALLAGALVLLTPETLGAKLPDTMEQAANMQKADT